MNQKIKLIISILILGLMPISFCFAQDDIIIEAPETFEEAQQMGEQVLEVGKRDLPGVIKELWYGKVLPMWQKMYDWAYINIWVKVKNFFGSRIEQEVETREEIIEQEFGKEKQELKEELPGVKKSIWEKIKELWK